MGKFLEGQKVPLPTPRPRRQHPRTPETHSELITALPPLATAECLIPRLLLREQSLSISSCPPIATPNTLDGAQSESAR